MKWTNQNKKTVALMGLFFITFCGLYNAIVINADTDLSSFQRHFVMRLDEAYGKYQPGRAVAASFEWKKMPTPVNAEAPLLKKDPAIVKANEIQREEMLESKIQENVDLNLVEVINPKKWKTGLKVDQFSGELIANNGIIESLSVSLPNSEVISIAFAELRGNVFEYDMVGEVYTGMFYQVDQGSYMVTLSNGPLEGTRLRFSQGQLQDIQDQNQTTLSEKHNIEIGSFGGHEEHMDPLVLDDKQIQVEALEAQSFNFDQTQVL